MTLINTSEVTDRIVKNLNIQTVETIPKELEPKIQLTCETNPAKLRRTNTIYTGTCSNATSATVTTLPTTKDFFITGIQLSMIKDVTSTSVYVRVLGTAAYTGQGVTLAYIPSFTLTAHNEAISISLPYPIQMARGSVITIGHSTNVANMISNVVIYGYFVENGE